MPRRDKGRTPAFWGIQYPSLSIPSEFKLPGQIRDWQVKCVCGGTAIDCNSGWMHDIEVAAEPIMAPLIKGSAARLSAKDQTVIATWAIIKSIVGGYDSPITAMAHHMQRKYLMRHKKPLAGGFSVWIGSYDRNKWQPQWFSRPFLLLSEKALSKRSSLLATHYNSAATTQVVGKMFIHVIRAPMSQLVDWRGFALPERGSLFRVWPEPNYSIKWPGRTMSDLDAEHVANALSNFILDIQRDRGLTAPQYAR